MSFFFSLSPQQAALLATLIGLILADDLDLDEQNALGNFLQAIGQTIIVNAGQAAVIQADEKDKDEIKCRLKALKEEIEILENKLNKKR